MNLAIEKLTKILYAIWPIINTFSLIFPCCEKPFIHFSVSPPEAPPPNWLSILLLSQIPVPPCKILYFIKLFGYLNLRAHFTIDYILIFLRQFILYNLFHFFVIIIINFRSVQSVNRQHGLPKRLKSSLAFI